MPINRSDFITNADGSFSGTVRLDSRVIKATVRATTGDIDAAWNNLEALVEVLRKQMGSVESAVRDLLSRLGDPNEETPAGRRKIERMLGELGSSNASCRVYENSASVFFEAPRLTGHCIELQYRDREIDGATIAG